MLFTQEETAAINIAREHNVGDLGLGLRPGQSPDTLANHVAATGNIMAGQLINRAHPEANYSFVWVPFDEPTDEFYFDCKEDGYKPVLEADWILVKGPWEFGLADTQKKRWSETRLLIRRDSFLMFRDEAAYNAMMAKRLDFSDDQIERRYDDWQDNAASKGVDTRTIVGGEERVVKRGRPRKSVDLGG